MEKIIVLNMDKPLKIKHRHGQPLEVAPKSTPTPKKQKPMRLVKHKNVYVGNPEDLVHMNWFSYWNQEDTK